MWGDSGPQAIAISEMLAYCEGLEMHGVEFRERFLDTIQDMDAAYLTGIAKKQKTAAAAGPAKSDVVGGPPRGDNT